MTWVITYAKGAVDEGDCLTTLIENRAQHHVERESDIGYHLSPPLIIDLDFIDGDTVLTQTGDTVAKLNAGLARGIAACREHIAGLTDYEEHNTHWGL